MGEGLVFAATLPWALGLPAFEVCIMLKGCFGKPSRGPNYHSRYFTGLTHALFGFGVAVNPRG